MSQQFGEGYGPLWNPSVKDQILAASASVAWWKYEYDNDPLTLRLKVERAQEALERATNPDRPFKRQCPSCGAVVSYTKQGHRDYAERRGSVCLKCRSAQQYQRKQQAALLSRSCPECDAVITYRHKCHYTRAVQRGTVCGSCAAEKRRQRERDAKMIRME